MVLIIIIIIISTRIIANCSNINWFLDWLSDDRLSDDRLSDDRLSDGRLSDDRLSDDRLSDDRLSDDRLSDDRLSDDRLSDDRLSDAWCDEFYYYSLCCWGSRFIWQRIIVPGWLMVECHQKEPFPGSIKERKSAVITHGEETDLL